MCNEGACCFLPLLSGLALWCSLSGCSGRSGSDAVRPGLARETLVSVLTAWRDGQTPEEQQHRTPAIVVQDMDWAHGTVLTDFELQGDGKALGANLSIEVKLMLTDATGESSAENVWYLVGTDPVLTVFRDMLHPSGF